MQWFLKITAFKDPKTRKQKPKFTRKLCTFKICANFTLETHC